MTEKKAFIDFLSETPISIEKRRHYKHGTHFESEFDNPYYLITWKLKGNKKVTVRIDAPDFYDSKRLNVKGVYQLKRIVFTHYRFYGLFPVHNSVDLSSLSADTVSQIIARGKEVVKNGTMVDLNEYL